MIHRAFPVVATVFVLAGCSGGGGQSSTAQNPDAIERFGVETSRSLSKSVSAPDSMAIHLRCDEINRTQGTTPNATGGSAASVGGAHLMAGVERGGIALSDVDQITAPASGLLPDPSTMTIACWIRIDGDPRARLLDLGGLRIDLAAGGISLTVEGSDDNAPVVATHAITGDLTGGGWHHLAVMTHAGDADVAIDGVVVAAGRDVPMLEQPGQLRIGGGWWGTVDDVRLYPIALSTDQLHAITTLDAGMVGWWTFDEGTGSDVSDASGYGHHAAASNLVWWPGVADTAGRFNGQTSRVTVTGGESLDLGGRLSLSAWVRVDDASTDLYRRIISKKTYWNQPDGFELEYNPALGYLSMTAGNDNYARAEGVFLGSSWHHVAGVIDGSTARIYVDGVDVTTDSSAGVVEQGKAPLVLGQAADPALAQWTTWSGQLDDVRISNLSLSPAEITALARAKDKFRAVPPFTWVRKLYRETAPVASAVAASLDIERLELLEGDATAGSVRLRQWSGDDLAGTRSFAANTLIAPLSQPVAFSLRAFDIVVGNKTNGRYAWTRRTAQDARLRIGYATVPIPGGSDGQQLVLGGSAVGAGQIILSLPMHWTPPGTTSDWQTGDYKGNPEQTGIWLVPAGQSLASAQASSANRLADINDVLATAKPGSGRWTFDFRAVSGGWTLRVDSDGDGTFETTRTGSHPLSLPTGAPVMMAIEPAGGSKSGQVTRSDLTIGYQLLPQTVAN
jgi:hypothetical protein